MNSLPICRLTQVILQKTVQKTILKKSLLSLPIQEIRLKSQLTSCCYVTVRNFHGSVCLSAKKKGGKKDKGDDDDDDVPIVLPDMKNMELQMEKKLVRLTDEFAKLRNGQANTDLFRKVMVPGAGISVADAGQLTMKGPSKISIAVYDPTLVSEIAKAIRDCGMNLSPVTDGNNVVISIPKPSKDTKDLLVKAASKIADKAKQDIRQVRKDGMDLLKKLKGAIADDDIKRYTKEVDAMMEKNIEKITKTLKDKESDLLKE